MGQHTPEPWRVLDSGCDGLSLVQTAHVTRDVWELPRVPEDLHRIVACVNALAGIPDPDAFVKAARELAKQCESVLVVMELSPSDLDGDQPDLELNNMEDAAEEFRAADRSQL